MLCGLTPFIAQRRIEVPKAAVVTFKEFYNLEVNKFHPKLWGSSKMNSSSPKSFLSFLTEDQLTQLQIQNTFSKLRDITL